MKPLSINLRVPIALNLFANLLLSAVPVFVSAQEMSDREVQAFHQPIATTVQLPTFGVSFDADGVLQMQTFNDPTGQLREKQLRAAAIAVRGDLGKANRERKVSLVRLEAAIAERLAAGERLSDAMSFLAGLTRITAAFCFPAGDLSEPGDIVIVGPAEPWVEDFGGVARGLRSGQPTLRLDDLVVALRAYHADAPPLGFVGCSIGPNRDGLTRLNEFQRRIPKIVRMNQRNVIANQVAEKTRDSLGPSKVSVFGISGRTHFARVMIEADYRMKRMAIGVEPTPVPITTYARAMKTASHGTLERWWLTPSYDGVLATQDRMAMQLSGQGVQLKTEMKRINEDGTIVDGRGTPNRAATLFAKSFTKQYEALMQVSTVYAQLRQLCDQLILTAFMQRHHWHKSAQWTASVFLDEQSFPIQTLARPDTAPAVVNSFWKQNRMFVPVGGGVSIQVAEALSQVKTADDGILNQRGAIRPDKPRDVWWWD